MPTTPAAQEAEARGPAEQGLPRLQRIAWATYTESLKRKSKMRPGGYTLMVELLRTHHVQGHSFNSRALPTHLPTYLNTYIHVYIHAYYMLYVEVNQNINL